MKRRYSTADKIKIVEDYFSSGLSQSEYALKYEISDRLLRMWIAKFKKNTRSKTSFIKTQIEIANRALKKSIRQLQAVVDSWDQVLQSEEISEDAIEAAREGIRLVEANNTVLAQVNRAIDTGGEDPTKIEPERVNPDDVGKRTKFDWNFE